MPISPRANKLALVLAVTAMNLAIAAAVHYGWSVPTEASAATKPAVVSLSEEEKTISMVAKTSPAVVSIAVQKRAEQTLTVGEASDEDAWDEYGQGTGFLVSADGMIVTNRHVAADRAARYKVFLQDGRVFEARILDIDPVNDLALLRVDGKNLPKLELEADDRLRIGQTVVVIGNALGKYANTVTRGILSGLERDLDATNSLTGGVERLEDILQTDAAINSGNSGGPLLNSDGKVMGVSVAVEFGARGLGFGIPVSEVRKVMSSYARYGAIARPRLGVRYVMLTPETALELGMDRVAGAYVTAEKEEGPAVIPQSPAASAGLLTGDIITEINGQKLEGKRTLAKVIQGYAVGDAVTLKVLRLGQTLALVARLDAHPPYAP